MNKSIKSFILAIILIFAFSVPAFAASSTFLTKAQRYYDQNCNRRNISNETSLQCYVFDKINELQTSLNSLTGRVTNVENKNATQDQLILDLQTKNASQDAEITELANELEMVSAVPDPKEIVVFTFQQLTNGQESSVFSTTGYRQIVLDGDSQNGSGGFGLWYSDDQISWIQEGGVSVASGLSNEHKQMSFRVKGLYYKVKIFNSFQGSSSLVLY